MSSLFGKFKTGATPSSPTQNSQSSKKGDLAAELTPLQRMLQNAGPIRPDGSDKFFGMENFSNTCYCNSIVQALYYSVPFREHVVRYPPLSPLNTPNGAPKEPAVRVLNGAPLSPKIKEKGLSAAEAIKRRQAVSNAPPPTGQPGTRPEDKPDSPEYKKKQAMLTGPILELTYENASTYGMEESTFTALKDIFMATIHSQSRTGVLSPQRFLEIFKRDNEMFRTAMHQDAHEFYGLVLNAVITNVEENAKRLRELEPPKTLSLNQSFANALSHAIPGFSGKTDSPNTGWVHDIFEGVLTSETKCLTCEIASQRDETFLDLSIDLEQHSSVTSCLRKFSAEEMLCEKNKFHCDNCGGLQEAERRMKIKRLPKILTLHLKRFKYTEDLTRLQKLFHRVVYPYHLRMFNTTDDAEDPDRLYELYCVVVHIGGNAYHGHYVAIIKTEDKGWCLFDDEMVEPVDKQYVRNFFGDRPGMACAYVLFYQETTLEKVQREQEAEGAADVAFASQEAGVALGHPQPNGTYPSSLSKQVTLAVTPTEEREHLSPLNHSFTAPSPAKPDATLIPPVPFSPKLENTPKGDKERLKKEAKEAEKARKAWEKAAEKEKVKFEEQRKRDIETRKREYQRSQAEEVRLALLASKQSAAAEDEKRRQDGGVFGDGSQPEKKENGIISGLGLSRHHKGSKSMSRKSLGWLKGEGSKGDPAPDDDVTPLPDRSDKQDKSTKERFSFGLGRKKSTLLSPS